MRRADWRPPDRWVYAYLLGLYLGDGWIGRHRGSTVLHICLDGAYPEIVAEAERAIERTVPGARLNQYLRPESAGVRLQCWNPIWPQVFPQCGAGKKHERRIELVPWQLEITERHPKQLTRGLIHSDGCRTVNRFSVDLPVGGRREYEYPRYFFSNLSADIRAIFVRHCELVGIRCTQSNHRNISISHRASVALLDEFVGPKR